MTNKTIFLSLPIESANLIETTLKKVVADLTEKGEYDKAYDVLFTLQDLKKQMEVEDE